MYSYNWYQWLAFFYTYCFFGWCIESTYVSIRKKHFVNRGFLRLPMIPIYGSGAVIMLFVSIPVRHNLFLVFLFGMIAASALEYVTGYVMERLFKMKYWDYSNNKFQLHGYICLGTSIAWGFLSIALTELIHTPVERFLLSLNHSLLITLVVIVSVLFVADTIQSVKAALDLGKMLETMTRLKQELEEIQNSLAELRTEAEQRAEELRNEAGQRAEDLIESAMERRDAALEHIGNLAEAAQEAAEAARKRGEEEQEKLRMRLKALTAEREGLPTRLDFFKRSLVKGNPTASSRKFDEALREIKEYLDSKGKPHTGNGHIGNGHTGNGHSGYGR